MEDIGAHMGDRRQTTRPARTQLKTFLGYLTKLRKRRAMTIDLELIADEDELESSLTG